MRVGTRTCRCEHAHAGGNALALATPSVPHSPHDPTPHTRASSTLLHTTPHTHAKVTLAVGKTLARVRATNKQRLSTCVASLPGDLHVDWAS
eukprot:268249-Chlamydomonas_euryale.AAC.3